MDYSRTACYPIDRRVHLWIPGAVDVELRLERIYRPGRRIGRNGLQLCDMGPISRLNELVPRL